MNTSRILDFSDKSHDGMSGWFAEMSLKDLLFHPDDSPSSIVTIATNEPMFTPDECNKLDAIMAEMFSMHGNEVHEAAYPIFMNRFGLRLDA